MNEHMRGHFPFLLPEVIGEYVFKSKGKGNYRTKVFIITPDMYHSTLKRMSEDDFKGHIILKTINKSKLIKVNKV